MHEYALEHSNTDKKQTCSFMCALLRCFSFIHQPIHTVSSHTPTYSPYRPRRLRKRRRPSRPMLHVGIYGADKDIYLSPYEEIEKFEEFKCAVPEEDKVDFSLYTHLSQFVPHTLDTIEEVDSEYTYGQEWRPARPVLRRIPGIRQLREDENVSAETKKADFMDFSGLPKHSYVLVPRSPLAPPY
ncbi:hypothetical protein K439DRAFT_1631002, partial [Ramaria rubella]